MICVHLFYLWLEEKIPVLAKSHPNIDSRHKIQDWILIGIHIVKLETMTTRKLRIKQPEHILDSPTTRSRLH